MREELRLSICYRGHSFNFIDTLPIVLFSGRWGTHYEARFAKRHNGKWTWRFHCREHGCSHHYSPNSATGTLKRHFSSDHRAAYNEIQRAASQQPARQPTLFELPVPQRALDRLATAALNWVIQSMQPFSALDAPAFREMIQAVNPQVRLPCSATIRAMLADHTLLLEDMREKYCMGVYVVEEIVRRRCGSIEPHHGYLLLLVVDQGKLLMINLDGAQRRKCLHLWCSRA